MNNKAFELAAAFAAYEKYLNDSSRNGGNKDAVNDTNGGNDKNSRSAVPANAVTLQTKRETDIDLAAIADTKMEAKIYLATLANTNVKAEIDLAAIVTIKMQAEIDMLQSVLTVMPGHVYWVGMNGRYLGCNYFYAKSAGLKHRKDIVGKTHQDLPRNYQAKALPEVQDRINAEVMQTGKTIIAKEPIVLSNGTRKVFLSTKTPLRNRQEQIIGMAGFSVDITARKAAEKAIDLAIIHADTAHRVETEFLKNVRRDMLAKMPLGE